MRLRCVSLRSYHPPLRQLPAATSCQVVSAIAEPRHFTFSLVFLQDMLPKGPIFPLTPLREALLPEQGG
jgi:hypothetical protein